ncbi:MAG: 2OG-Fe(II) oxygenase [Myxococcaceae bacterium]
MELPLIPDPDRPLDTRNPLVMVVPNVLTPAQCRAWVERIEAAGPEPAPVTTSRGFVMMPGLRNNTRVMFDDAPFAARLFDALAPHLPRRLEGEWEACGANERLRCYRYAPGQFFGPHFDGAFHRTDDEQSLLTLMVYLNDCEAGGHTLFHDLELAVTPRPGTALIFNHHLRHEGAPVKAGLKYAVRSDVMFRRVRASL